MEDMRREKDMRDKKVERMKISKVVNGTRSHYSCGGNCNNILINLNRLIAFQLFKSSIVNLIFKKYKKYQI